MLSFACRHSFLTVSGFGWSRRHNVDMIAPLDHWASAGVAPQSITASKSANGVVTRTRPLLPYPQEAATGRELAAPMKRLILCAQCRSTDGKAQSSSARR